MTPQDPNTLPPVKLNPFYKQPEIDLDRREFLAVVAVGVTYVATSANAADPPPVEGRPKGKGGGGRSGDFVLPSKLAEFAELSVVLGRATDRSVTASLLSQSAAEGFLEIGTASGKYTRKTPLTKLPAGSPVELEVSRLEPNTIYYYRLQYRRAGATEFTLRPECRFVTQRAAGSTFTFTIQGDSHPERMGKVTDPELYARTIQLAAAAAPDFHICIGDDFSVEHVRTVSPETMTAPYLLQRPFLGLIGQTAPVFLMNGNHEQASLYNYNQTDARRDVAVSTQVARNRLYPTPSAGAFYSGDPTPWKDIGELKSYCAWTWGDALFVLLDNYWHSPALVDSGWQGEDAHPKQGGQNPQGKKGGKGGGKDRDWWGISLGNAQYQWLKKTLEQSKAKYKFVFAHHVLGTGRGGVEEADLFEWGGKDNRGNAVDFAVKRPGWELPIHALMAKHKVNIFFQGHDHLYCRQEKDGIVYQELPMPSDHTYAALNEDRYPAGTKIANSGYLRVTVAPEQVHVEYVRTYLPKDENDQRKSGEIAHRYVIQPKNARA